ncbi:uncharacterized protein METZ01_LOCUS258370, partial [marine metagenome]
MPFYSIIILFIGDVMKVYPPEAYPPQN